MYFLLFMQTTVEVSMESIYCKETQHVHRWDCWGCNMFTFLPSLLAQYLSDFSHVVFMFFWPAKTIEQPLLVEVVVIAGTGRTSKVGANCPHVRIYGFKRMVTWRVMSEVLGKVNYQHEIKIVVFQVVVHPCLVNCPEFGQVLWRAVGIPSDTEKVAEAGKCSFLTPLLTWGASEGNQHCFLHFLLFLGQKVSAKSTHGVVRKKQVFGERKNWKKWWRIGG